MVRFVGTLVACALAMYLLGSAPTFASYRVRRIHRVVLTADGQHAIAVGARGTALASRDGGATWSSIALATQLDLYGVALSADGSHGIIVGDEGLVLVTHDAGASWGMRRSETPDPLYDVSMSADGRHAVAVGWLGSVISSHDGGTSWMLREILRREDLTRVAISPDGQHAWTSGLARDFAGPWWFTTKDGGSTWAPETAAQTECVAQDFAFDRDAQNAWLLLDVVQCNGQFVVSADGGKSWREQGERVPQNRRLFTAAATDAQHVWAGGMAGSVMATSDGGAHWTWQKTGAKGVLFSMAFAKDAQRGVVASKDGELFFTHDGGKSWRPSQLPAQAAAPGASR